MGNNATHYCCNNVLLRRMVYAKPFCIVYGTHTDDRVKAQYMLQSATYLANANVAAHSTFVPLFSDVEYLAAMARDPSMQLNVIFIGGALENKAMNHFQQKSPVVFTEENGFVVDDQFLFRKEAVIFTLPLGVDALGVCVHALTPSDFLHLSRLMWPTIPPMVRTQAHTLSPLFFFSSFSFSFNIYILFDSFFACRVVGSGSFCELLA